jgi:hypothetical protein
MTPLEIHQRGLLDLIKGRGADGEDDPYLQRVAGSRELGMLREIALWWRKLHVERQCRFTSRLLKRLGKLDSLVSRYFRDNATSPFIEELALDFLRMLSAHPDRLIRAVSQFEFAFLQVRSGSAESFEVCWDRHPDLVIRALEEGADLPVADDEIVYRMRIGESVPGLFACKRESAAHEAVHS